MADACLSCFLGAAACGSCLPLASDTTDDHSTGTGSNTDPNPALSENTAPGNFRSDAVTLRAGITYAF
jgi:hypothetical protein